jgi:cytochrome c oxidase subunit 2
MLNPMGPQARHIYELWVLMLGVCGVVFAAIMVVLAIVILKRPRATETTPAAGSYAPAAAAGTRSIIAAAVFSVAGLLILLVASVMTDRALASLEEQDALQLEITGHQWWWEIQYKDADPSRTFNTANELHVPTGRAVSVTLKADDVIHSFWVPNLHGKKDMIPGRDATIRFRADQPGTYRGQCAEFCGYQHAYMALLVIAEPPAQFEEWKNAQLASASAPSTAEARRGQQVFESTTCAMCHAIQGTQAGARMAPDLTHVGSRQTVAAGTLVNTPENLARWIADPQKIKPGVNMPASALEKPDLDALVAYLRSLQ